MYIDIKLLMCTIGSFNPCGWHYEKLNFRVAASYYVVGERGGNIEN